jgi:acetylornithine/succinyldiaminopimelate/putrescine aminotransferase
MLLIFDEVQCGVGRAGYLYAFQEFGIKPDILCSAKGIAAGFPMGAVMASQKVANCIEPGNHGTTFGGNPLACAVALTTLQIISNNNFLDEIKDKSQYFISRLNKELSQFKEFVEVRGKGLIIGVQLNIPSRPVVLKMLEKGVIVNSTADSVIRILPPLIISKAEIDRIVEVLIISLKETLTN